MAKLLSGNPPSSGNILSQTKKNVGQGLVDNAVPSGKRPKIPASHTFSYTLPGRRGPREQSQCCFTSRKGPPALRQKRNSTAARIAAQHAHMLSYPQPRTSNWQYTPAFFRRLDPNKSAQVPSRRPGGTHPGCLVKVGKFAKMCFGRVNERLPDGF